MADNKPTMAGALDEARKSALEVASHGTRPYEAGFEIRSPILDYGESEGLDSSASDDRIS